MIAKNNGKEICAKLDSQLASKIQANFYETEADGPCYTN